jgi:acetyltransferase-like isoleucine patch superfamily enzyme
MQIEDNAMIGCNSVVTRHVAANNIVAGIPAKPVKVKDDPSVVAGVLEKLES